MKRILGHLLLCLLGFSSCQTETIPTSSSTSLQSTIEVSDATKLSSPDVITRVHTSTVLSAKPSSIEVLDNASEALVEPIERVSLTTDVELAQAIEVYRRSYCGTCHTLTIAETIGTFGPSQDGIGLIAEQRVNDPNYTGTATNAADYLLESLVEPQAYIVAGYELSRHKMPPFSQLSDEELQAIVYLLLQQK